MLGMRIESTVRSTGPGYGFWAAQNAGLARSSTGVAAICPDYESGTTPVGKRGGWDAATLAYDTGHLPAARSGDEKIAVDLIWAG
jgi:hypothetical protein